MCNIVSTNEDSRHELELHSMKPKGIQLPFAGSFDSRVAPDALVGTKGAQSEAVLSRKVAIGLNMQRALITCAQMKSRLFALSKEGLGLRLPPVEQCSKPLELVNYGHLDSSSAHFDSKY